MIANLSDVIIFHFLDRFGEPKLDLQYDIHWPVINEFILEQPHDQVIAFDLRGLDYFGYSYAKQTIRKALMKRNQGHYGHRTLFLIAQNNEYFLDGINDALSQEELFMLLVDDPQEMIRHGVLIGKVKDYVSSTFDLLCDLAPISTASLAETIQQSPQNTKNRLDKLFRMGLLFREKHPSPTGGLEWINQIFKTDH